MRVESQGLEKNGGKYEEDGGSQFYALAMETAYLLSLCSQRTIAGRRAHTTQTRKAVVREVTNTIYKRH